MHITDAIRALDRDLREIFGARLESLVAYRGHAQGGAARTLAVVTSLSAADLRACASKVAAWREQGIATPLLLGAREFERSLDAFPFEFGAILADHALVSGRDPFRGAAVDTADLRHACEVQARGLLLHLREGYVETEGRSDRVADLLQRSAAALAPLLVNVAHLVGAPGRDAASAAVDVEQRLGLSNTGLAEIVSFSEARPLTADAARRIFPAYLGALEQLTTMVDTWSARA